MNKIEQHNPVGVVGGGVGGDRREDGVGQICKKALEDMSKFKEFILLTEDNEENVKSLDRSGVKHELF